ncbi:MAG TPA: hypothetical protein VGD51_01985 [Nocardioidaceae bacterium]|jgi:hypothetical protein
MTYQRLAYDDASTSSEMTSDCRAVEAALHLPERRSAAERAATAATKPAPSILFEDYPREVKKPTITVSEAAARLGAALDQHLD